MTVVSEVFDFCVNTTLRIRPWPGEFVDCELDKAIIPDSVEAIGKEVFGNSCISVLYMQ